MSGSTLSVRRSKLLLAALLMAFLFTTQWVPARADTQYYGSIEGKTYLNNFWDNFSHGAWGSTWETSGAWVDSLREELHPEYATWDCYYWITWAWCLAPPGGWTSWYSRPTKVVDQYANYVSTDDFMSDNAMRGWSWHKNWSNGSQGNTSDGY